MLKDGKIRGTTLLEANASNSIAAAIMRGRALVTVGIPAGLIIAVSAATQDQDWPIRGVGSAHVCRSSFHHPRIAGG